MKKNKNILNERLLYYYLQDLQYTLRGYELHVNHIQALFYNFIHPYNLIIPADQLNFF